MKLSKFAPCLGVLLLFGSMTHGRTLYVDCKNYPPQRPPDGSAANPYYQPGAAYAHSSPGDTIVLRSCVYDGHWRLTKPLRLVSEGGVASLSSYNQAPEVDAGRNQTVEGLTALLQGVATDDGLPSPPGRLELEWFQFRNGAPGIAAFKSPNAASTHVTVSAYGTYVFRLVANDGRILNSDGVTIVFQRGGGGTTPQNSPPTVKISPPGSVVFPQNLPIAATVSDDGRPTPAHLSMRWSTVSGPALVTFEPQDAANTTASFPAPGEYRVRLTADDGKANSFAEGVITVKSKPGDNQPPWVDAGDPQTISFGSDCILNGQAGDDGLPNPPSKLTTSWRRVSGPGSATFVNSQLLKTKVRFSLPGTYVLALDADDTARKTTDSVSIIYQGSNVAPLVGAGQDQIVDLPDAVFLNGVITEDGLPNPPGKVTVAWSKITGPGSVAFGSPDRANTTAKFSLPGSYRLQLSGNDSAKTGTDTIDVMVKEASDYLIRYEGEKHCYDFGRDLRIKNTHPRRRISYVIIVRYSTRFSGEYEETKSGVLAPGESREYACSDRVGGPGGRGYVSDRIVSAGFVTSSQLAFAAEGVQLHDEMSYEISDTSILLSWPSYLQDIYIESSGFVNSPTAWQHVKESVVEADGRNTVIVPRHGNSQFFRLRPN